uniref:Uncharacterized protein n=1 Tax=Physcomitrium patens TaxID=3218 RepID=A0A7I3ZDZ4_PHYPA
MLAPCQIIWRNFRCTGEKYPYAASPSRDLLTLILLPTPITLRDVRSFCKTDDARWCTEDALIAPAKSGIRKILVTALCVYLPSDQAAQLMLLQHWTWCLAAGSSARHSSFL